MFSLLFPSVVRRAELLWFGPCFSLVSIWAENPRGVPLRTSAWAWPSSLSSPERDRERSNSFAVQVGIFANKQTNKPRGQTGRGGTGGTGTHGRTGREGWQHWGKGRNIFSFLSSNSLLPTSPLLSANSVRIRRSDGCELPDSGQVLHIGFRRAIIVSRTLFKPFGKKMIVSRTLFKPFGNKMIVSRTLFFRGPS